MGRKTLTYEEYLTSDVWLCGKSPTGAHHWVEIQRGRYSAHTGVFYCKYCGDAKEFPIHISAAQLC